MYTDFEINMPKRYVDLSENEMEYDGLGSTGDAVSVVVGVGGGIISICTLNPVGVALGVASIAGSIAALHEAHKGTGSVPNPFPQGTPAVLSTSSNPAVLGKRTG